VWEQSSFVRRKGMYEYDKARESLALNLRCRQMIKIVLADPMGRNRFAALFDSGKLGPAKALLLMMVWS